MARYKLRHANTDLELPSGEFVIGRSSQCHLTIDDALVSRRHARIVSENGGLFIEDLGSRNGYRINGVETRDRTALRHLDRVRIGNQDLVVVDQSMESPASRSAAFCRMCGAGISPGDRQCGVCGAVVGGAQRLDHATIELQLPSAMNRGSDAPRASAFALVGNIANKALAMGRVEEAERMIGQLVEDVGGRLSQSETPDADLLRETTEFAMKLAEGPNGAKWIGWVLGLYTKLKRPPDAAVVDAVHELVRRARFTDTKAVARLIEVAGNNPRLTAGERFVVKRLETLQRIVGA